MTSLVKAFIPAISKLREGGAFKTQEGRTERLTEFFKSVGGIGTPTIHGPTLPARASQTAVAAVAKPKTNEAAASSASGTSKVASTVASVFKRRQLKAAGGSTLGSPTSLLGG